MNNALKQLKELTPKLPSIVVSEKSPAIEYNVANGMCFGLALVNTNNVSVQIAVMSKGAEFPAHDHKSEEFLIIYRGKLIVKELGKEFGIGEHIHFPAGFLHTVVALEDTKMIAVAVPSEEGYPDE